MRQITDTDHRHTRLITDTQKHMRQIKIIQTQETDPQTHVRLITDTQD